MGDKKKKDKSKAKEKEDKARKKELREKLERERKQKELEAEADAMVDPIYASGLADAYKCTFANRVDFLQELYKEGVRFNIY
jgi:GH24 family phage-related lysozyme (muramidase)